MMLTLSLIIIIVGIIVFFIYKKKLIKNKNKEIKKTKIDKKTKLDTLIDLELKINSNNIYFQNKENFFNNLYNLVNKIETEYDFNTSMFFEIKNLIEEHLPNRINSFINLTEENKNSRKIEFINDIQRMNKVIVNTLEVLNKNNLSADERESLLIQIKY